MSTPLSWTACAHTGLFLFFCLFVEYCSDFCSLLWLSPGSLVSHWLVSPAASGWSLGPGLIRWGGEAAPGAVAPSLGRPHHFPAARQAPKCSLVGVGKAPRVQYQSSWIEPLACPQTRWHEFTGVSQAA